MRIYIKNNIETLVLNFVFKYYKSIMVIKSVLKKYLIIRFIMIFINVTVTSHLTVRLYYTKYDKTWFGKTIFCINCIGQLVYRKFSRVLFIALYK